MIDCLSWQDANITWKDLKGWLIRDNKPGEEEYPYTIVSRVEDGGDETFWLTGLYWLESLEEVLNNYKASGTRQVLDGEFSFNKDLSDLIPVKRIF